MPTASSASTAVLLATVLVFGLLPYYALGLSIDTVSWILVPQIVAAAMTQFILFHGYANITLPSVGNVLGGWLLGSVLWHVVFVLFGAALIQDSVHTFGVSSLASALTAIPATRLTGFKVHNAVDHYCCHGSLGALDRMAMFQSIGVVVGMYASAVVLPLDWDRPWQVWPCPCILGAWVGCFLGNTAYRILMSQDSHCHSNQNLKFA